MRKEDWPIHSFHRYMQYQKIYRVINNLVRVWNKETAKRDWKSELVLQTNKPYKQIKQDSLLHHHQHHLTVSSHEEAFYKSTPKHIPYVVFQGSRGEILSYSKTCSVKSSTFIFSTSFVKSSNNLHSLEEPNV